MAASEGKPLMQNHDDLPDLDDTACACGCFRFNRWRRVPNDGEGGGGGGASAWVAEKLKKAKEVSELIAGPKWKTFIRKISNRKHNNNNNNNNRYQFQYDEHSYALNFNSGANSEDDDDPPHIPPSFSARFAAPRQPPQSSVNSASPL